MCLALILFFFLIVMVTIILIYPRIIGGQKLWKSMVEYCVCQGMSLAFCFFISPKTEALLHENHEKPHTFCRCGVFGTIAVYEKHQRQQKA